MRSPVPAAYGPGAVVWCGRGMGYGLWGAAAVSLVVSPGGGGLRVGYWGLGGGYVYWLAGTVSMGSGWASMRAAVSMGSAAVSPGGCGGLPRRWSPWRRSPSAVVSLGLPWWWRSLAVGLSKSGSGVAQERLRSPAVAGLLRSGVLRQHQRSTGCDGYIWAPMRAAVYGLGSGGSGDGLRLAGTGAGLGLYGLGGSVVVETKKAERRPRALRLTTAVKALTA